MPQKIEETVLINATPSIVWEHLTKPVLMKQWIGEPEMEIEIHTNWQVGQPITITGFHHVRFENKGNILQFVPNKIIQYSHLSSVSHLTNDPKNYSIITFNLTSVQNQTSLSLTVENFPTETIFKHFDLYWKATLEIIKKSIESRN